MCGIFGVTNVTDAAKMASFGLFALQHRGQESAGLSARDDDGMIKTHRAEGLVIDVFQNKVLENLRGSHAIGHVRYATTGGHSPGNIQPLNVRIGGVHISLCHNGNIVNSESIREKLEKSGAILQGTADTELIVHLIARNLKKTFLEKLRSSLMQLEGAFSLLILTPTHLYAVVDRHSFRPLSLASLPDNGWVLSSETCAMDLVGAQFIRDLKPGEILAIDLSTGNMQSTSLFEDTSTFKNSPSARCIFEQVYFARPDSVLWGMLSYDARFKMGQYLAKENVVKADMVIAVPDSGVPMAMGYADASGIPYRVGLTRNHYVGRTFITPTQTVRNLRVRLKLNPIRQVVNGKKIIIVDDSVVRGTTSKKIIELLRDFGAKEVHLRIGSPPVKFPCYYGIDTPHRQELLAQTNSLEQMCEYLQADSLGFLSEKNLLLAVGKGKGWCTACFSGKYKTKTALLKIQNKETPCPKH